MARIVMDKMVKGTFFILFVCAFLSFAGPALGVNPPPTHVSPADLATGVSVTPTLTWNPVGAATSYDVLLYSWDFLDVRVINTGLATTTGVITTPLGGDTRYFWSLRANGGGAADWSDPWEFQTTCAAPQAPVLLFPSDLSTDVSPILDFDWEGQLGEGVPGATEYVLRVCADAGCASVVQTASFPTTEGGLPSALAGNTMYYWDVQANNACGAGGISTRWSFTTGPAPPCTPPAAPALNSPSNGLTGVTTTPTLNWSVVSGATSYFAQLCSDPGCSSVVQSQTLVGNTNTSWNPAALANNTTYYWRVQVSASGCGAGSFSGTWNFTTGTGGCTPPAAPALSSPANGLTGVSTLPTLSWSAVTGATSYLAQLCSDPGCVTVVQSATLVGNTNTSWNPTVLAGSTIYYWQVQAIGACAGSFSSRWNFTTGTGCTVPDVPSLVSPVDNSTDVSQTPTLDWTDVAEATSYNVRACNDSACTSVIRTENVPGSQWVATPAFTQGALVHWQVQARNACGDSTWTPSWQFTVCSPPGSPSLVSPADGTLFVSPTPTLDWTDAPNATSYDVQICADSACTVILHTGTLTGSQWNISPMYPLTLGMQHFWRVSPVSGCGSGAWTGTWSFITSLTPRVLDFNGDLMADILWQHITRGDIYFWLMDTIHILEGIGISSNADSDKGIAGTGSVNILEGVGMLGVEDPDWKIVSADDMDEDGNPDILWQHITRGDIFLWLMDGTNVLGGVDMGSIAADTDWKIVSTEDFNGDGMLDLLWQHQVRGDIYLWLMDGTDLLAGAPGVDMGGVVDRDWRIVGTADFNGDLKPDILWQHQVRGDVYLWLMNGILFLDGVDLGSIEDADWRIAGTDDYNGDMMPDILWQHKTSGEIAVWLMDNTEFLASVSIATVEDNDWMITAPK